MSAEEKTLTVPRILIVDDNKNYREAFRRNLMLQGYEVSEAADTDEALDHLSRGELDVVVTDLSMRHATEGLDLIRQMRAINPHLPIIMISAVGTFEEGAEASRLGARTVISKSKIDEEMDNLFRAIDEAFEEYGRSQECLRQLETLRTQAQENPSGSIGELRRMVSRPETPASVKGEAYDLLNEINTAEMEQVTRQEFNRAKDDAGTRELFDRVDENLNEALADYTRLDADSREALRSAEFLYLHGETLGSPVDFSRSIGFSYCFAVESEAKARLRRKLQKFFGDSKMPKLVQSFLEKHGRSISVFYHQYLLRVQRDNHLDVTIDNVYQTFQRMLEHTGRYKPDGLKALGIVILCFGRTYSFKKFNDMVTVDNPIGLKGFESDEEAIRFARLLTNLQHYRNPYIHPEISEMEKLSKIRETTLECMNIVHKIE